jgi:hypothetical protein
MTTDKIIYRGVRVTADWPERIEQAQLETTCLPDGVEMPRVRYGAEEDDWGADRQPCHDCAVIKGEVHVFGCDVELCPKCGGQMLGCDCSYPGDDEDDET